MAVRGKDFYSMLEREKEFIEKLYSEEVTASEAPQIANLQRQKTRIENEIRNKEVQVKKLQEEIQAKQQEVARINERISRMKSS